MKGCLYYVLGFISAIVLMFLIGILFVSMPAGEDSENATYFEEPKAFSSSRVFEVYEVIDDTAAIAYEMELYGADSYMRGKIRVLITNENGEYYYDNQRINVPRNKKVEQIGVYRNHSETIPIIEIAE